ncbi:unnamed protein product [Cuscuta europaea]|uniref:Reverse transcriptase Ty1/copia-type domain-containing protein n=1 Tax=Cuscuta europaea TaxID=41803 RepID=A0A9P1EG47_CUSEU|nr:unnamed protein product [Cuscuta europaea]
MTNLVEPSDYHEAVRDPKWRLAMQHEIDALERNGTWSIQLVPPAVAAIQHWELHQMDVDNAFLHGDLHEEVYMHLPPGYTTSSPGQVRRLHRSLYGLRHAPCCWFSKLTTALRRYDIGHMKYFLVLEVARNPYGIFLCQRKYLLDILAETGFGGARPANFPMTQNHRLQLDSSSLFSAPDQYRRLVGKLIYLTLTRPDISYSVHILTQFMQHPRVALWEVAIRVLRYLKSHPGQGILLRSDSSLSLTGYCDSDWASCPLTRRSLSGYFVTLGSFPISWRTKKQVTVSRSSAEAEYRSMASLTCELIWLKSLLSSLGVSHTDPIHLLCDNQAALHIASNPVFHERTKHIEIDCHFLRDHVQHQTICLSHKASSEQLADIFTKALGAEQFHYLLSKMGVFYLHAPS